MPATAPPRRFVPKDLGFDDFTQIAGLFKSLLDRNIASPAELEKWLLDYSELHAVIDEFGQRRYVAMTCHTDDPEIERQFLHFVEYIEPQVKPLHFAMQKKFVESPHRSGLTDAKYQLLGRKWQADVELFRDQNVPLQTEETKLNNEYDKICGAMLVNFRGKEHTQQQMARYQEDTDRATRQQAWEAATNRRLQDVDKIEDIFDQLQSLRWRMARNCGLANSRDYYFKLYKRFDYTPDDCLRFADAIADHAVPLMRKLDRERARDMGIDRLRPWDLAVDPKGRPPLRPFEESDIEGFVARTADVFNRLSPALGKDFDELRQTGNLDLASRKGKAPGGYQTAFMESRTPFIFMNAVGLHSDVITMIHEGGHAFHTLAARHEPLTFLIHAPIEFCEVASMSMELLTMPHWGVFYDDPADAARARRDQLAIRVVRVLPWIATIDSFQHWLYTHPGHTRDERAQAWLQIVQRFGPEVDWSGWEHWNRRRWQAQLHLFGVPFYYVEYGIAQLGALQLWLKSKSDPHGALAAYRRGLSLGDTRPLPQLFAAAGIHFDFSAKTVQPLMQAIEEELEKVEN